MIDGWTGFIIEWLMLGRLDLGVIYDHTLKSDLLHVEPLVAEEQFLICRPNDRLSKRSKVTLAEVAELPLALPSREHGLRFAVDDRFNSIGVRALIKIEIDSMVGLRRFVEQGKAYTILPRGELDADLAVGRLVAVRIIKPTIHRTLFAAWHAERPVSAQMKAVLHILKEETANSVSTGVLGERVPRRQMDGRLGGATISVERALSASTLTPFAERQLAACAVGTRNRPKRNRYPLPNSTCPSRICSNSTRNSALGAVHNVR